MKKLDWIWTVERTDVPKWIATDIGRIAVEWSYLEFQTQEIIRLLMVTHIKFARIISARMMLRTKLLNISDLLHSYVYYDQLPQQLLDEFSSISEFINSQIERERNDLIHGTWGRVEGKWLLIRTPRGSRGHSQLKKFKLPRAVLPQHTEWTSAKSQKVRDNISKARADLDAFTTKLEAALPPSPHISPRRIPQSRPSRALRNNASAVPP